MEKWNSVTKTIVEEYLEKWMWKQSGKMGRWNSVTRTEVEEYRIEVR